MPVAYLDEARTPRLLEPLPPSCIRPRRERRYPKSSSRAALKERDGAVCMRCGAPERPGEPGDDGTIWGGFYLERHHVYAFTLGGCSHPHNLVMLCQPCNLDVGVVS